MKNYSSLSPSVLEIILKQNKSRSALLPALEQIAKESVEITSAMQQDLADILSIHPVEVYSLISFYSFLKNKRAKYSVRLCRSLSCRMRDSFRIAEAIERELGISFGETTPDKILSLDYVNCLGLCDLSPAMLVNQTPYYRLSVTKALSIIKALK